MNPQRNSSLLLFGLFLASLLGCDGIPGTGSKAQAILKVNRARTKGNASDFMIYKETQAALLRSNFVISAALRNQRISEIQGVSLPAIQQALTVQVSETELMFVTLAHGPWSKPETTKILNAVIEAYQSEVVNKERIAKVDQLTKLRRRYQTAYQMVTKKSDEVTATAKQLGSVDQESVATRMEIMKSKVQHLDSTLIQLELKKIEIAADDKVAMAIAQKKIDFVRAESEKLVAEIGEFKESSGQLVARREDLLALQQDMHDVREAMLKLESEIDGPPAISVIQAAALVK